MRIPGAAEETRRTTIVLIPFHCSFAAWNITLTSYNYVIVIVSSHTSALNARQPFLYQLRPLRAGGRLSAFRSLVPLPLSLFLSLPAWSGSFARASVQGCTCINAARISTVRAPFSTVAARCSRNCNLRPLFRLFIPRTCDSCGGAVSTHSIHRLNVCSWLVTFSFAHSTLSRGRSFTR